MKREPVENSLPGSYHIGDNNPAYIKNSKIKYQVACTYINKWRNKLVFKQRNRSFNKYMKVLKFLVMREMQIRTTLDSVSAH
jgi:hypothetical protein